jgi:YD repeat-containing protein
VTSKNISNDKYEWSPSYNSNELYSTNALNQYFDIGSITQSHDDNGNLTQDGSMTFVFNALGQMTEAKPGGTTVGTYQYDPMGRRKSNTAAGITTE